MTTVKEEARDLLNRMGPHIRAKLAATQRAGFRPVEIALKTAWARADRRWFAKHTKHTKRSIRARDAFPDETPFGNGVDFVLVTQMRPGWRFRQPFTLMYAQPDLIPALQELALRALDDNQGEAAERACMTLAHLPTTHEISPAEFWGLIAIYDRPVSARTS
jgi:hypothetical protein